MTQHQGLPVAGYKPQSAEKVAAVNVNKELEERCLRQIEDCYSLDGVNRALLNEGLAAIRNAFMIVNRGVFDPERIKLPEDGEFHLYDKDATYQAGDLVVILGNVWRAKAEVQGFYEHALDSAMGIAPKPEWEATTIRPPRMPS